MGIETAEATRLPMMVHINGTFNRLPVILKMLRKGDVNTHCFSGYEQDSPLDANGKVLPEVWDARQRGVIFDVAEGRTHPSGYLRYLESKIAHINEASSAWLVKH